jgi:hypothetical protein
VQGESLNLATKFMLYPNFPNPFNPTTTIGFDIPEVSDVKVVVYDLLSRKVEVLVNRQLAAGKHRVHFEAAHLPSRACVYELFARSESGKEYRASQKLMLLK